MTITENIFGYDLQGQPVRLFRIVLPGGIRTEICELGATLVSVVVPDRNGVLQDVVLGYADTAGYVADTCYIGATVGRFAGRIGHAQFTLGEKTYRLEKNDGENTNHGGFAGFHRKTWKSEILSDGIRFTLDSPDGEGGYPGKLEIAVTYTFPASDTLRIRFEGRTDRAAYLNLTNHSYFNLAGSGDITGHTLFLPATHILETDERYIPTGRILSVKGTPFDFTVPRRIGARLHDSDRQLGRNRGYNHFYFSGAPSGKEAVFTGTLSDPQSGRYMDFYTTLPGTVLYTGNFLESTVPGKAGRLYTPYDGVCLETQYCPDTPNHPEFPSCLITPERPYNEYTEYRFGAN